MIYTLQNLKNPSRLFYYMLSFILISVTFSAINDTSEPDKPASCTLYCTVREPLGLICLTFPDAKITRLYTDATNGFICTDWTGNVAVNRLSRTSSSIEIYKGRHKVRTISFKEDESLAGWTSDGLLYGVGNQMRVLDIQTGESEPAPELSGIFRTAAAEAWWAGASYTEDGIAVLLFRKGDPGAAFVRLIKDVNGGVGDFLILKDRYVALTVDKGWKTKQAPDKRLLLLDSVTRRQIAEQKVDWVDVAPDSRNRDIIVARFESHGHDKTLHINRMTIPSLKEISIGTLKCNPNVSFYGISQDERLVYLMSYPDHGPGTILVKDLKTGKTLYSRKEVDQIVAAQGYR